MGLLIAELFAPTFGVLGAGGVAALIAGGVLLFDSEMPGFGVPLALVLGLAAASAAIVLPAAAWRSRRVAGPSSAAAKAWWASRAKYCK